MLGIGKCVTHFLMQITSIKLIHQLHLIGIILQLQGTMEDSGEPVSSIRANVLAVSL
jgi:hypothetical protein